MNRQEFITKLREELEKNNISNKEEIIQKYQKRFDIGLEANMSEEEIVNKQDTIENIVKSEGTISPEICTASDSKTNDENKEAEEKPVEKKIDYNGDYAKLAISVVADNIDFISTPNFNKLHIDFNDANPEDYSVSIENNTINIGFAPKSNFLKKMHRSNLKIYIPESIQWESISINVTSSKISFNTLKTKELSISGVSGTFDGVEVKADKMAVNIVSGNFNVDNLISENTSIHLVSGNTKIKYSEITKLTLRTVTGSVKIDDGFVSTSEVSALTGKLFIKGQRVGK